MKKIFKLIYPYSYLNSKWWHRLILVIIILISLCVGVIGWIYVRDNFTPWENYSTYVKINNYNNDEYMPVCLKTTYICTQLHVSNFIEKNNSVDLLNFIDKNPELKEYNFRKAQGFYINFGDIEIDNNYIVKKTSLVNLLEKQDLIQIRNESNLNLINIFLTIIGSLITFFLTLIVFFIFIYRIILYIAYGSNLGK